MQLSFLMAANTERWLWWDWIDRNTDLIRDALVRQLYLPVQWTNCVQALAARGVNRIGECGPGKVLSGLAKRIDKSLEARALGTVGDFDTAIGEWKA